MLKWLGAVLIIVGCGGWGFWMAANYRKEERMLKQLEDFLLDMENELSCRHSPLPVLFRRSVPGMHWELARVMNLLAEQMEKMVLPDVQCCMDSVLGQTVLLPGSVKQLLQELGRSLGRYDLDGQLRELRAVRESCSQRVCTHRQERDSRIRGYQTLGLCAGAALAILLL